MFNEDQARNRKGHGPANLALLWKTALNLARLEPSKGSRRGKLNRARWDNDSLLAILTQFANPLLRLPLLNREVAFRFRWSGYLVGAGLKPASTNSEGLFPSQTT